MKIEQINVGDNLIYTEQYFGEEHEVVVTEKTRCASDRFYLRAKLTDKDDRLPNNCVGILLLVWEKEDIKQLKSIN
jgi:hypothetical protein